LIYYKIFAYRSLWCSEVNKREFDGAKKPLSKPLPHRERGFETLIIALITQNTYAPLRIEEELGRGSSNSR
jgi:hypothetical protein